MALHQIARGGRAFAGADASPAAAASLAPRSGDIAILNDNGSLVVGTNNFDLGGVGLRFEPNGQGGYDVVRMSADFRGDLGRRVSLADDATSEEALAFSFSFYGASRGSAFVNSDGNLTFTRGDIATDDRSLGRVLSGPPRVAAFFADLDPSRGGGVFVSSTASAFTVTWCNVPDFDNTGRVTAQATLLPGGSVEMRFDASTTLRDAVVALSPGATTGFAPVDLSGASAATPGGAAAVGERFASERSIDLVGAARLFYSEFGDDYDQLVFWTDTRVTDADTFAFESTVKNQIRGIGQEQPRPRLRVRQRRPARERRADGHAHEVPGGSEPARQRREHLDVAGGPRDRPPLGRHAGVPRRRRKQRRLARPAARALELLHRLRRLRARGQRDPGPGRQLPHRDPVAALLALRPLLDGRAVRVRRAARPSTSRRPIVTDPTSLGVDRESAPRSCVSMNGHAARGDDRRGGRRDGRAQPGRRQRPARPPPGVDLRDERGPRGRLAAAIAKLETFRRAFEDFFASATGGRMSVETRLEPRRAYRDRATVGACP